MYILATTTTYQADTKYYSKSGDTYTLLVAGTDYTIGGTITGTVYEGAEYDRLYIKGWGSSGAYKRFPYKIGGVDTLPVHDVSANDVDLDAYTNTKGYTIRNRVRHDVPSLDFNVGTMTGEEFHNFLSRTTNVWLDCYFFYEPSWSFVSKKMYRSGTVKYTKYFVDASDPNKNIYTDIQFSFVEQ